MFNITRSVTLATLFACLLQLSLGATIPTRTVKEDIIAARRAATKRAPLTSAARLRQTNAREIRARNIIRNDPLYKRQQSSARVYPTCSADFAPLLTSARYVGSDMAGGMATEGQWYAEPFEAYSEEECYEIATEQPGAIGYYWSASDSMCSLKVSLGAPETWMSSNDPGQTGSVTVLFGDCNTFNGAVPAQFQNTCCGMTGDQTVGNSPQQCSPQVAAPLPVARFLGRRMYGNDLPVEAGGMPTVASEAQCIQACWNTFG
ncbi:hypothetical protein NCC49_004803 [Naganishia albida]|nr:hypothetical protein NCC49_004803 [Naganishia albida]